MAAFNACSRYLSIDSKYCTHTDTHSHWTQYADNMEVSRLIYYCRTNAVRRVHRPNNYFYYFMDLLMYRPRRKIVYEWLLCMGDNNNTKCM